MATATPDERSLGPARSTLGDRAAFARPERIDALAAECVAGTLRGRACRRFEAQISGGVAALAVNGEPPTGTPTRPLPCAGAARNSPCESERQRVRRVQRTSGTLEPDSGRMEGG